MESGLYFFFNSCLNSELNSFSLCLFFFDSRMQRMALSKYVHLTWVEYAMQDFWWDELDFC